jgi:hypothetical protein
MRPTALIALVFLVVGCGSGQSSSDETPTTPTTTNTTIDRPPGDSGHLIEREPPPTPRPADEPEVTRNGADDDGRHGPPPIVVRNRTTVLRLDPWTFCYGVMCADGFPPDPLPDAGTGAELEVTFPLEGWKFSASFQSVDHPSAPATAVEVERAGPDSFVMRPNGLTGTYAVELFGQGDGDVIVSFLWTVG